MIFEKDNEHDRLFYFENFIRNLSKLLKDDEIPISFYSLKGFWRGFYRGPKPSSGSSEMETWKYFELAFPSLKLKDIYSATRFFKEYLFSGAGGYSEFLHSLLHERLDVGLSELSGEQQNGGMGSEYDDQSAAESKEIIDSVIEDVIAALGASARFKKL